MVAVTVLAAISVRYIASRGCIRVEPAGDYTYKPEIHRIRTRRGMAVVTVEDAQFGSYPNVDTGPEGYALAVKLPRQVALEVRLINNDWIDHVEVDGRTLRIPSEKKAPIWLIRVKGGEHYLKLAWKPTE